MHIPQSLMGWTIFASGLLAIAYRIHGIDAPRQWIEWVERQFTYSTNLRFIGAILFLAAAALAYLAGVPGSIDVLGALFFLSLLFLALAGFCLLVLQNHLRHLILATAEASDAKLRIASIIIVLLGLGWAIAPFFF